MSDTRRLGLALLLCAGTAACDVGDAADGAKVCSNVCPVGTSPDLSAKATAECGGSANVNVTTQSGSLEGRCYGEGECTVVCVPPAPCCGEMVWSVSEYRCTATCCPDGSSPPCGGNCSCEGRCGKLDCGVVCPACEGDLLCSSDGVCVDACEPSRSCGNYCCSSKQTCHNLLCCDALANCEGKDCGSDGCGGSCGECEWHESCESGLCIAQGCSPDCAGQDCGSDGCGGSCGDCGTDESCNGGNCIPNDCTPDCNERECGSDGCGGSCGDCLDDETCDEGSCVPSACPPDCLGRECGSDGCGGSCGTCSTGQQCGASGQCACAPSCAGKECGSNNCGGSCGSCGAGESCVGGKCAPDCAPQCDGKQCGADGCGGSCGTCSSGKQCDPSGLCVCVPSCAGKECGSDKCGGSCGSCGENESCVGDQCTPICIPDCSGKACGSDGCGGSCGSCNDSISCTSNDCSAAGVCSYKPNNALCNDSDVCTDDWCDGDQGCVHEDNAAACDDGDKCTQTDLCSGGGCKGSGALDCDDGKATTLDTCDSAKGCVHTQLPTWYDSSTDLTWQITPASTKKTWSSAESTCDSLELGGLGGWRLPTIGELRSIVDGCKSTEPGGSCGVTDGCLKSSCANLTANCDGCAASGGPSGGAYWVNALKGPWDTYYWSASLLDTNYSDSYWTLQFSDATVKAWDSSSGLSNYYVRCVRDGS